MPHRLRRRVVALLALALALLGVAVPAGPAPATAAASSRPAAPAPGLPPVLKVGTEGVYAPFSYHDGKGRLTGYDVEVMRALGQRLGVRVEFVEVPWDSMFAALESRRIDLVANQVSRNPERAAKYDLSSSYVSSTGVVVTRTGDRRVQRLADVRGLRAAQNPTSSWAEVAKKAGAQVVAVEGLTEALLNLEQGRVDVVVNDELAVRSYLATRKDAKVAIAAPTPDRSAAVLAARKDSGYLPALDDGLARMRADGTLQRIYDRYFAAQDSGTSRWQLIRDNAWPMLQAMLTRTIPLTAISFVLGLALAVAVALARMSRSRLLSAPARAYISVIRGTPLLVQLVLIFYGLPELGIRISPWPAAIIAFSLNVAGYAAEIVRAALESIPKGQWEAAATVGMDRHTALRRVIVPQAARTAVPPLSNTLVSLLKDTSLASTILVVELFRRAQTAAAPTFEFFTLYGLAAVYYYLACLVLTALQSRAETRLSRFVAA